MFPYLTLKDRATFRRIVLKNAYMKRKMYEQLLESVPLLKHLEVSYTFHINVNKTEMREVNTIVSLI